MTYREWWGSLSREEQERTTRFAVWEAAVRLERRRCADLVARSLGKGDLYYETVNGEEPSPVEPPIPR